jgi:hypothetical protein
VKNFIKIAFFLFVSTGLYAQETPFFSQVDSLKFAGSRGITFDAQGNYYATGDAESMLNYNQEPVNNPYEGAYIAKFNLAHELQWIVQPSAYTYNSNVSNAITLDNEGNPVIGGLYNTPFIFGDDTLTTQNGGYNNPFVAKFSNDGELRWATRIHSPSLTSGGQVTSLASDSQGNIYFAGNFGGTLTVAGNTIQSVGYSDLFWGKLNSQGEIQWIKAAGSDLIDDGISIAVGPEDNLYINGNITSVSQATTAYFDNSSIPVDDDGYGFIVKYTPTGQLLWSQNPDIGDYWLGKRNQEQKISVQEDGSAVILASGYPTNQLLSISGVTLNVTNNPEDKSMIFALKVDAQGNGLWITQVFNVGFFPSSITSNQDNNVFLSAIPSGGYLTGPYNNIPITPSIEGNTIVLEYQTFFIFQLNGQTGDIMSYGHPSESNFYLLYSMDSYNGKILSTGYRGYSNEKTAIITEINTEALSLPSKIIDNTSIRVYPNPTNGRFTVKWSNFKIKSLTVYDISGKLLFSKSTNGPQTSVNLDDASPGVYFLMLKSEQGFLTRKVVVD